MPCECVFKNVDQRRLSQVAALQSTQAKHGAQWQLHPAKGPMIQQRFLALLASSCFKALNKVCVDLDELKVQNHMRIGNELQLQYLMVP